MFHFILTCIVLHPVWHVCHIMQIAPTRARRDRKHARSGETLNPLICIVMHLKSRALARISNIMHHLHRHAYAVHPGLGDLKSSEGAIPSVFVVPERLSVVW